MAPFLDGHAFVCFPTVLRAMVPEGKGVLCPKFSIPMVKPNARAGRYAPCGYIYDYRTIEDAPFTLPLGSTHVAGSEAEWIRERPWLNGALADMADYGVVSVTGATATNVCQSNTAGLHRRYPGDEQQPGDVQRLLHLRWQQHPFDLDGEWSARYAL
jgi:hypothetical protein